MAQKRHAEATAASVAKKPHTEASAPVVVLAILSAAELKQLCAAFDLMPLPDSARTLAGDPGKPPEPKKWRTAYPSEAIQQEWKDMAQNTPGWKLARSGSSGSSEQAPFAGWCSFHGNVELWMLHTAQVAEPPKTAEQMRPINAGHWFENNTAVLYAIVMQTYVYEKGVFLHRKYPFKHTSPDRLTENRRHVFHNKHTLLDAFLALLEIKNPVYSAHVCKFNGLAPHHITPHYLIQIQDQMEVMGLPHNDFASSWRFSEMMPMWRQTASRLLNDTYAHEVRDTPTRQALARDQQCMYLLRTRLPSKLAEVIHEYAREGGLAFVIGHMLITRFYYQRDFCEQLIQLQLRHMQAVHTRQRPQRLWHVDLPAVRMLPLKQVVWYLHTDPELHPIFLSGHQYHEKPIGRIVRGEAVHYPVNPVVCRSSTQHLTVRLKDVFSADQLASPLLRTDPRQSSVDVEAMKGQAPWVRPSQLELTYLSVVVESFWDHPPTYRDVHDFEDGGVRYHSD